VYLALLATFGQDQGLLRYLPEVLGRGDRAAAHDLLRKSAFAVVVAWAVTSALVIALRPLIDSVLHAHIADLLALGTVLLLGTIAAGVLSFALVAIYDMRSQAIATPIAGALTLALALLFLRRGWQLPGVLLAGAVSRRWRRSISASSCGASVAPRASLVTESAGGVCSFMRVAGCRAC
jgi:O-antigen/teichoic acid export membrane protein